MLKKTTTLLVLTAQAVLLSVVAFAATSVTDVDVKDTPQYWPDPECGEEDCS